ncbi:esterase-like activity of phytase family protein, partial [Allosphingosinicella sp.]|uniref:esterase-like activity of phytase family protein n=1 Tax=Allosphingosinicella sp. TaxID=2823234 RepID=UPI002F18567B
SEWPSNGGSEAMVRLGDGRFLVFAEGPVGDDGTTPVLLFEGDPAVAGTRFAELRYRPLPGYRITDAAVLPDGRILFLNRRWAFLGGFAAAVAIADSPELRPGTVIEARELAVLGSPLTIDNLEALSVVVEGGRTVLWIASDDNFNPVLQQTLLLKFALTE